MDEVRALASQDVREVMLLGQIVDRYGLDLDEDIDLADLLREVAAIPELYRVRFLTSHPNWITDKLIEAVAGEPKVCPQIEIAVQSGNDTVLERMRRGYTGTAYRALIERVRDHIPDAAIHTDVIVGFPGETDEQFMDTYRLMEDVRFDKVHIAKYSERPGTAAAVRFDDNIPAEEKERRRKMLEDLQKKIQTEKAEGLARMTVEVLVEERDRERWRGRTPHNKIVFFEDERDLAGQLVDVKIDWAGPFSLIGKKA
jgi:tRNA-2-methylthio-N6-dimethylallyladenosine synthase